MVKVLEFDTHSGSRYRYDSNTKIFERVSKGPDAGELSSETGKCIEEPRIAVGHCALFFCEPSNPLKRGTRMVCTSRVTEIREVA